MNIMQRLVERRKRAGLTQRDMARLLGVGQSRISVLESGRHDPLPGSLDAYARALGLEVADVILPEGYREEAIELENRYQTPQNAD